jgi:hypothetical protein
MCVVKGRRTIEQKLGVRGADDCWPSHCVRCRQQACRIVGEEVAVHARPIQDVVGLEREQNVLWEEKIINLFPSFGIGLALLKNQIISLFYFSPQSFDIVAFIFLK